MLRRANQTIILASPHDTREAMVKAGGRVDSRGECRRRYATGQSGLKEP